MRDEPTLDSVQEVFHDRELWKCSADSVYFDRFEGKRVCLLLQPITKISSQKRSMEDVYGSLLQLVPHIGDTELDRNTLEVGIRLEGDLSFFPCRATLAFFCKDELATTLSIVMGRIGTLVKSRQTICNFDGILQRLELIQSLYCKKPNSHVEGNAECLNICKVTDEVF